MQRSSGENAQVHKCLCSRLRDLQLDSLKTGLTEPYEPVRLRQPDGRPRPSLGKRARAIIRRVRQFFEEVEARLGWQCAGTILNTPLETTAVACGVSYSTAQRIGKPAVYLHEPVPRKQPRHRTSAKQWRAAIVKKYGAEWGEVVRTKIHQKLKDEAVVTLHDLHDELKENENFKMSVATLHRFLREDGRGQRRGDYIVYMDETWIFDEMTRKRGWVDNTIPRFPSASTIERYSCGKTTAKNKGKRATVIGAIAEDGIIPECTRVLISGVRTIDDDYHKDMNYKTFEKWLKEALPVMNDRADKANKRRVTLIIDNAPYHSRHEEKIPGHNATKKEIVEFLASNGVDVAVDSTHAELLNELDEYVQSHGGIAALRKYATEKICTDFGVNVIRLPPFHCFFNPIELCWSQLKSYLTKIGRPTDKITAVKQRTEEWMKQVSVQLTQAWFRHVLREEEAARLKDLQDDNENSTRSSSSSTSSEQSMESDDDDNNLSET
ncbi:hypothetical protein OESDEN_08006 [Oesophagostomum dentatum]|uniref:Tc1-like transposase DDE domain-containing protein n=1 Tax=Oesophagostomum dentatum TaxID=61180 RepID=A0A0B1T4H0_OESDE|nr:hypothetical protein OESDEN_08006 [Oesophagostomum dentatum]